MLRGSHRLLYNLWANLTLQDFDTLCSFVMHAYIVACLLETSSSWWDLDIADVGRWLWSWLGLCLWGSCSHRLHLLSIIGVLKTTVSTGGWLVLSYATMRYKVRIYMLWFMSGKY